MEDTELTPGRGYKLVALKTVTPSKELAQEHYADLSSRPFFPGLVSYITSGVPVVAMVWEGKDVIKQGVSFMGERDWARGERPPCDGASPSPRLHFRVESRHGGRGDLEQRRWCGGDCSRGGTNTQRRIVGATNPLDADPGSVRGQYAVSVGRNLIHASDSFDSATKEIGLWFKEAELSNYETAAWTWIMSDN